MQDRVVIITGASSGIGAATAREMAPLGAKLVLAARSENQLRALAQPLDTETLVVKTDVTQKGDVLNLVEQTIERFGRVDVMFANAGIYTYGDMAAGDPNDWAHLMDVNVNGVFRCAHAVLPHMKQQQSGDILVTSSISGLMDEKWEHVYSASKNAVQTFVHTLRRHVIDDGIRVGAIAPGSVASSRWEETDPARLSENGRGRLTAQDVARAVVFMLSQPRHVTIRDLV
ncbi:MAG: SDR family oxidoreductase, partial [Chloroflexota bacterium]